MNPINILLTLVGLIAALHLSTAEQRKTGNDVFQLVPEKSRGDFIRLHLGLGLLQTVIQPTNTDNIIHKHKNWLRNYFNFSDEELDTIEKLSTIKVPDDFSVNLLYWIEQEMDLSRTNIVQLVTEGLVCTPSGCFNPSDLGPYCCPF